MSDAAIYVVFTDVPEDREEAFNRWYNETHIPDLLKLGCVKGAQRFKLNGEGPEMRMRDGSLHRPRYLALYFLNSGEESVIKQQLAEARPGWVAQGRLFDGLMSGGGSLFATITERFHD